MTKELKQAALDYHALPAPGKIGIAITKPCDSQLDLSLAYTPGVAEPVRAIAADKESAYKYTIKGNLVAVVTDGTAVLGLGNVGALAGKPVMEGKAVLFKRFANIDVFDIEVDSDTPEQFIETVERIATTFGGINLEDIAAPHCFEIEKRLVEKLDIPVFHDDQHGTAIIIAAGLMNALELQGKAIETTKIVCLGAGAAGIASMALLVSLGAQRENLRLVDRQGVIRSTRSDLNEYKQAFAIETDDVTLEDAMNNADVFIGVSGPNLVSKEMLASMADNPTVFALSNPDPEISPELAHSVRNDLIMATGRSDYPNQVNNVLGFPFIFRGALDVRAKMINEEMKVAAVKALCALAREPVPDEVLEAYQVESMSFGADYIIPKPLDSRLMGYVASAVALAAVESGVAALPYPDHYPPLCDLPG
ncbi:MAG: malate dehydrogenase [Gammaproteobacteria bacterium]|nr:malate dehydrogenase [Gammaproteobacteria bacterium]MCF6229363.1 malate dehydrogenase [Gammaproteobacteria bacterium]